VPTFVENFQNVPIPFAEPKLYQSRGIPSIKTFNYENELKDFERDRNLDKLPEWMSKNLYEFQKKGIEYGVRRFGRMLLGDEMGVGKTI